MAWRWLSVRAEAVWLAAVALGIGAPGAQAQDVALASRGPRFLYASTPRATPRPIDPASTPVLRRQISLDLDGTTLPDALSAITRQTGLAFVYSRDVVSTATRVHLRAEQITVAGALNEILLDAGVDVLLSGGAQAALVKRAEPLPPPPGSIAGKVTDAKSGQALAGATVVVEGTHHVATTAGDGKYRIVDVAPGTYTVRARYIGYAPQAVSVSVNAAEEATVDVALEHSAQRLDEVVTTGTVTETRVKELPTPITVITAEDIQRLGIVRVDQLFRGTVPGGVSFDPGTTDYYSVISLRGTNSLTFNSVKTYIDGIEVTDPSYIANIDPNSIERMEILRGPQASAVYGAGAISGVIQIFTKKGNPDGGRAHLEGKAALGAIQSDFVSGAKLRQDYNLGVNGGAPAFTYQLQGSHRRIGEWVPYFWDHNSAVTGGARVTQGRLGAEFSLRYEAKTYSREYDTRLRDLGYSLWQNPPTELDELRQQGFGVKLQYAAAHWWEHNLTLGYDRLFSDYFDRPTPADSLLTVNSAELSKPSVAYNTTANARLGGSLTAALTAGADYYELRTTTFGTTDAAQSNGLIGGASLLAFRTVSDNKGAFVQARLGFGDALFLSGALRAEQNSDFGQAVGTPLMPRAGIAYSRQVGRVTVKARASYGEAIRQPPLNAGQGYVTPYSVLVGNPTLRPERQRGWDGGLELYVGDRVSLGVTYYNQHALDLINFSILPPDASGLLKFQYQNAGRVDNSGLELEGSARWRTLQASGTFSITNSIFRDAGPSYTGGLLPGDRLLGIPRTSGGATVTWTPAPRTSLIGTMTAFGSWTAIDGLSLYGYYYGGQSYRGSERAYWIRYPAITKFGFAVNQGLTPFLTAFARVDNLTDVRRFEQNNVTFPIGRTTTVGAQFRY